MNLVMSFFIRIFNLFLMSYKKCKENCMILCFNMDGILLKWRMFKSCSNFIKNFSRLFSSSFFISSNNISKKDMMFFWVFIFFLCKIS